MENSLLRYLIIPHPAQGSVLVLPSPAGWTLPEWLWLPAYLLRKPLPGK